MSGAELGRLLVRAQPAAGVVVSRSGEMVSVATSQGMATVSAAREVKPGDRVVIADGVARSSARAGLVVQV